MLVIKETKKKKKKKDTCWEKKSQKKKGCCNQVRTEKLEKWCATIPKWVGAWGTRSHKFRKGLKPSTQGNNYPLTDCGNIEVRQHEGFFSFFLMHSTPQHSGTLMFTWGRESSRFGTSGYFSPGRSSLCTESADFLLLPGSGLHGTTCRQAAGQHNTKLNIL